MWRRGDYVDHNGVKKVLEPVRLLRRFRKLDGRWFNDDETWDYTDFDPQEVKK